MFEGSFGMSYDGLYNGSSEGFSFLADGYIDYAQEVIARRSIPDLRDGLKPVGRRILYAIKTSIKTEGLSKCGTLVGRVMELHPHGDSSIYGALCNMTDINGSLNVPLFDGQGEFGRVFSSDVPAAMRYTKAKLNRNADDYFRDMAACKLIPSEEGEGFEPEVLPVRYPSVLINGTTGMAVGVATGIPSFNFRDVIELTIKGIKVGFDKLDATNDVIYPDLPTGGVLVTDGTELAKVMLVGKGRLKIRAKVEIQGKDILVKEVPYGRTVEGIRRAIQNGDFYGISDVIDSTGFNSDTLLTIQCKNKKIVESVLLDLYRAKVLQSSLTSNLLVTEDGIPEILGVFGVLENWVKWRRKVCTELLTKYDNDIQEELTTLSYFFRLIENTEWRNTYVDKAGKVSGKDAKAYLKSIFEDIPDTAVDWIADRKITAFANGGRYMKRYKELDDLNKLYKVYLSDIDSYIIKDLQDLLDEKASKFPRKTICSNKDYRFTVIKTEEAEDDSYCVYLLDREGFLAKVRDTFGYDMKNVLCEIHAQANSTLIGFDNFGRLIRVYGTDVPFTPMGNKGLYLPKYFDVVDNGVNTQAVNAYKILYLALLDGSKKYLLYKDGYIGSLDTSEYVGKKRMKIVSEGVCQEVYDKLLDVINEEDMPEYIMFADNNGNKTRFGLVETASIPTRGRRSRAKVLKGEKIWADYYALYSVMDLYKLTPEPNYYLDRMRPYKDIVGDLDAFQEGRYYVGDTQQ